MSSHPAVFENQPIRRVYDEATDIWWFSVVDIIKILTDQPDVRKAGTYWKVMKNRLSKEGSQLVTNCNQLKLTAEDGKLRLTDCATSETLLRLVQSVPSPRAEPIKLWLAKVGYERMQELADPTLSIDRARDIYKKQGRSDKWIAQRMTGQETRNKLTDYWAANKVQPGQEFAVLTNLIHQEWAGVSVKEHKDLKGLKSHNLRDHMSEAELIFTALAELSTRQVAETSAAKGMPANEKAARTGGSIARRARHELENLTGRKVVSKENYLPPTPKAKNALG
ncbi:MAG: BRO family protein [Acidobacteriaceae bacterium]